MLVGTLAVAACSGDVNPVRDVFVGVGIGGEAKPAPDFIKETRPASVDYMPIGVAAPARPTVKKTPDQVKAMESELDTLRTGNAEKGTEALQAGATPAPVAVPLPPPIVETPAPAKAAAKSGPAAKPAAKAKPKPEPRAAKPADAPAAQ